MPEPMTQTELERIQADFDTFATICTTDIGLLLAEVKRLQPIARAAIHWQEAEAALSNVRYDANVKHTAEQWQVVQAELALEEARCGLVVALARSSAALDSGKETE